MALLELQGNQTILLDQPHESWLVQSGQVALFAVTLVDGKPSGARRHLFDCRPGEACFGFSLMHQSQAVLAVAITPTVLQINPVVLGGDRLTTPLLPWLIRLEQVLDRSSEPVSVPELGAEFLSLSSKLRDSLQAATPDLLAHLHHLFLQLLSQQAQRAQQADRAHLQAQRALEHQRQQHTLTYLASLLAPATAPTVEPDLSGCPPEYQSLYRAASLVGDAIGMPIRLPLRAEGWQRLRDPLEAIARASQIRIRRVLLTDYWWQQDGGPLLAYLRQNNQPVALLPRPIGGYDLLDPTTGKANPVDLAIAAQLAPQAHSFYHGLPGQQIGIGHLLQLGLRGSGRDRWSLLGLGLAIALLGMALPQILALLLDHAIPAGDRGLLVQLGLTLLAAIGGATVCQWAQGVALLRLEARTEAILQPAFWDRLLNLPVPFFRRYAIGDLRARVAAISAIRHQVSGAPLRIGLSSVFSLLNLLLLAYYSPMLALVALAIVLLIGALTLTSSWAARSQVMPLQEADNYLLGFMVHLMQGVSKLRLAGAEARAFAHWGTYYGRQQRLRLRFQEIRDHLTLWNQALPVVGLICLFALVPTHLSTGTVLAFMAAFGSLMVATTSLSNTLLDLLPVLALWQQAQPILTTPPEVNTAKTDPGLLSGWVALDRVTFRYRPDGPAIVQNLSLQAHPGEFIALVGPSGSGKSTLFRLLLGFESPQSGQILYDGQDLRTLDVRAVRRQMGVMLQNSRTSTASIFENIACGALITMEEAWEAARLAGLAEEIAALPMGMHTIVSEGGGNLSGGQRQRLLIARALAHHPRLLLFDEATSSLDNQSQAIVRQSLEQLGITRIVIAHRLSTIEQADRIYVLQAGQMVQQGTFTELMAQEGLFARLMQRQL